jgi:branched-chain amino acid transport system permease protein
MKTADQQVRLTWATRVPGGVLAYRGGAHIIVLAVLAAVLIPAAVGPLGIFTWITVAIWVLFALGTNLIFGTTGLLSFGQTAFFGIGAYTVALLHEHKPDLSAPVLLVAGAVVAAAVASIFALGALRTKGAEFAVLTLALAQVLWLLVYRVDDLQGGDGFSGLYDIPLWGDRPLMDDTELWYWAIAVVGFCTWLLWLLHGSSLGRAMRAVRDDPWRASALGIKVRRVQVLSFAIAAAFGAVAGGLMAQQQGVVSPALLSLTISGEVLVACLVGGLRNFAGPIIGAIVLIQAQEILSGVTHEPDLFVGAFLLVIVLALPSGLTSLPRLLGQATRRHQARSSSEQSSPNDRVATEPPTVIPAETRERERA